MEKRTDNRKLQMPLTIKSQAEEQTPVTTGRDMWGIIEYNEFIVFTCSEVKSYINQISNLTKKIGEDMQIHTRELDMTRHNNNVLHTKSILLNAARDMNKYAKEIDEPNSIWYAKYLEVQQAIKEMLNVSEGFVSEKEWEGLVADLREMNNGMGNAYSGMRQFYSAVNKLPKIFQPLNIAKFNVCDKLKSIISNLQAGKSYCDETIEFIENRIHPLKG